MGEHPPEAPWVLCSEGATGDRSEISLLPSCQIVSFFSSLQAIINQLPGCHNSRAFSQNLAELRYSRKVS